MKKPFILIGKFFLYLIYVAITWNERNRYTLGSIRGHNITEYKLDLFGANIRYQPDIKPIRGYLTWREYWKLHNPYNKQTDGITS